MATNLDRGDLGSQIAELRPSFEDELGTLVRIPSVSMDPNHRADIDRCASAASKLLQKFEVQSEIIETAGFPLVLGKWFEDPNWKTVTIYNHMDVQPGGEPGWTREPFEFEIDGDRYLGRGATDDKGPGLTALFGARLAREAGVPLNFQFLWELEEEIGSPNFENALSDLVAAGFSTDSVLVSDTIWISKDKPAIPYGLRGMQLARLTIETGTKDAHSGLTGGAARNPIGEMAQLIAGLYDPRSGEVKFAGFYDDVIPPTEAELDSFESSGFTTANFQESHGLLNLRSSDVREITRRIWAHPTFEVHGIVGGYQGPGVKTVVPPRAEAKVSMRLVPGQNPDGIWEAFHSAVRALHADVSIESAGSLVPFRGEFEGPYADAARSAYRFGFDLEPSFIREGGSIGAVVSMQQLLGAPLSMMGLSLPEHGYHAPNEYYDWGQARGGMAMFAHYFEMIAAL